MDGATASIGMELEALQVIASPPTMLPKSEVDAVNLSSLGNILCCPITHELFIDPVLAEDGRTYEKEAITMYAIRIPSTNEYDLKFLQTDG